MRKTFTYLIEKQLLRHKLFYIIILAFACFLILVFQNTWFIRGWINYCNTAEISLADFNSIFELSAAFNLAYTVIKFKGDVSNRLYNWVDTSLKNAKIQVTNVILTVDKANRRNDELAEYIEDIGIRQDREKNNSHSNSENHSVDPFLYFGFYSIVCLIVGGLVEGINGSTPFKMEAYGFLLLFSIASVIYVELAFFLSKKSHFELTIMVFFIIIVLCFTCARNAEYLSLKEKIDSLYWKSELFYGKSNFKTAVNYCVLLCIFINLYPYFLIFRSLYFVCLQYTCTSYQIIFVVIAKMRVENSVDSVGVFLESAGDKIKGVGRTIRRNNGKG